MPSSRFDRLTKPADIQPAFYLVERGSLSVVALCETRIPTRHVLAKIRPVIFITDRADEYGQVTVTNEIPRGARNDNKPFVVKFSDRLACPQKTRGIRRGF
jgi:hypothetical protein